MIDKLTIENTVRQYGFDDFAWISGKDMEVHQRVRSKCMDGCASYCQSEHPPILPSIPECRDYFSEWEHILILHMAVNKDKPVDRQEWIRKKFIEFISIERTILLDGYRHARLLLMDEYSAFKDCTGDT